MKPERSFPVKFFRDGISKWIARMTIISYLLFPAYVVVYIATNHWFYYTMLDEGFHFASFFLDILFCLILLFNDFCIISSFIGLVENIVASAFQKKRKSLREWMKAISWGIVPGLLVFAVFQFRMVEVIQYLKFPFVVLQADWNWLMESL
jgi:hypothetical protein